MYPEEDVNVVGGEAQVLDAKALRFWGRHLVMASNPTHPMLAFCIPSVVSILSFGNTTARYSTPTSQIRLLDSQMYSMFEPRIPRAKF